MIVCHLYRRFAKTCDLREFTMFEHGAEGRWLAVEGNLSEEAALRDPIPG